MSKTFPLPRTRIEPDLADRIKADHEASGDRSVAATVRRLVERGLDNPFLTARDADKLDLALYELRQIGNNVNQLARRLNTHGGLQDFQLQELTAVTAKLSETNLTIRKLLTKAG